MCGVGDLPVGCSSAGPAKVSSFLGGPRHSSSVRRSPPRLCVVKKRPTLTAEYRILRNLSIYGSLSDFFGGGFKDVQRRYPDGGNTPGYAQFQRVQEWGFAVTLGLKGEF